MLITRKIKNKKLVDTKTVALECGVSIRRVQKMCQHGVIKNAYKINRGWLITYPIKFSKKSSRYQED